MNSSRTQTLRGWWVTLHVIAAAVLAVNIGCLVLAFAVTKTGGDGPASWAVQDEELRTTYALIRYALLGLSVPTIGCAFWLRSLLKRRQVPSIRGTVLPDTEEGRSMLCFYSAVRTSLAVAEAPASFGLVMFRVMGGLGYLVAFVVISMVAGVLLWPTQGEFLKMRPKENA